MKSEFGLLGLGVMGKSLSRNLAKKGFSLSLYNRHIRNKEEDVAVNFINSFQELSDCKGFDRIHEFTFSLEKPRIILLMIPAGKAIDQQLEELSKYLDSGDVVIDGGNSHYRDTHRRMKLLSTRGVQLIGAGISGGESGALTGPSIMPGGDSQAYNHAKKYLEALAAKDKAGDPCCTYIGPEGAGHFVKMVHNGIEYSEMQLLAEIYSLLRFGSDMKPDQIAKIFDTWGKTELNSYLLEITAQILRKKENNTWLIDQILDTAGNKGTGSWTTIAAAELGVPVPAITEALYARFLSFFKEERVSAAKKYGMNDDNNKPVEITIDEVKKAYKAARIINHHQGLQIIHAASNEYQWDLNTTEITRIWTNGCIIRSDLMESLPGILAESKQILLHPAIIKSVAENRAELSNIVIKALEAGFHIPCFTSALNYLNGYTTSQSNANIIQAQRDFFGAHTYKRTDDPDGVSHHTDW